MYKLSLSVSDIFIAYLLSVPETRTLSGKNLFFFLACKARSSL